MNIFLTIVNLPSDGFGSLMEYILGLVFFCDRYGFEYVHTDLEIIEHNNDISVDIWLKKWNECIQQIFLPNVKNSKEFKGDVQNINQLSFVPVSNTLFRLINSSYLKQILDTEQITNKLLRNNIINNFGAKTKNYIKDYDESTVNIAVHIRKYLKTDGDPSPWRELYERGNESDIYFQNIIKNLLFLIPNAKVHIYSQEEKDIFDHFLDISPNISIYTNNDIMHDLIHLSRANILVMSKGSFSRIANFYSNGVKIIRDGSTCVLSDNTLCVPKNGSLTYEQSVFIKKVIS